MGLWRGRRFRYRERRLSSYHRLNAEFEVWGLGYGMKRRREGIFYPLRIESYSLFSLALLPLFTIFFFLFSVQMRGDIYIYSCWGRKCFSVILVAHFIHVSCNARRDKVDRYKRKVVCRGSYISLSSPRSVNTKIYLLQICLFLFFLGMIFIFLLRENEGRNFSSFGLDSRGWSLRIRGG